MSWQYIDELRNFTRVSRYAKYLKKKGRRETWDEQVERVMNMHREYYKDNFEEIKDEFEFVWKYLSEMKILGSQRALQFGGQGILKKHARMYNCCATYIDRPRVFQEIMWLLLCGCGVGFSVQKHHIIKLPKIKVLPVDIMRTTYQIPDTIEGWADSVGVLVSSYFIEDSPFSQYQGQDVYIDYSLIRPKGSPLSTGGKAPGHKPLENAHKKIREVIEMRLESGEDRLRPIDAYDILMHLSDAVISGGIRRSACLSLFSPDDKEMLTAKTGNWFEKHPHRARSNNSVLLLRDEIEKSDFLKYIESVRQFGEPGFIFADDREMLFNPCCEISLRAYDEAGNSGFEMCNLTEINVKLAQTEEDFYNMCRAASILGTFQAGYTTFGYLGSITEEIVRRESLLGVSMTGIMDNPKIALDPRIQKHGAEIVKAVNKKLAKKLGINQASRTTCIKPAGTTSCILGTASGIHPHHSKMYFRRVQVNKIDPALEFFKKYNLDAVDESVWSANKSDDVITFLCEVPSDARTKVDMRALQLLEAVRLTQQNWVTSGKNPELCVDPSLNHNVSNTINVRDDEWESVAKFIYENRKWFAGISLLSATGDKDYAQTPFQRIYTEHELIDMYGSAALYASGLIVHAQNIFGNLYKACDTFLGIGENLNIPNLNGTDAITNAKKVLEKRMWIEQAKKFARKYIVNKIHKDELEKKSIDIKSEKVDLFGKTDDIPYEVKRQLTYCLKDIDASKKWDDLKMTYKPVPWEKFYEKKDGTKRVVDMTACSGGACELIRI
jgi:ribonucleoside-triphosphate reductase (thioredoxin)